MAYWNTEPAIKQNLVDAKCGESLIAKYFTLEGQKNEQLKLLTTHRKTLLDAMHEVQKAIDCLDFLLYKMRDEA